MLERRGGSWSGYLAILHRIDRPASGAIAFATERKAARKISRQFERRQVEKIYWACVEGEVTPASGTWVDTIRKIPDAARAEVVDADHAEGRRAVLHYRTLRTGPFGSWLRIELETGRTHQIRVQAAWRGHSVLGDAQYGSTAPFGEQHADERRRAIGLHARRLAFEHPESGATVSVVAPVSEDWIKLGIGNES
jgi:23S rRNA pseudouridine1911/1915/1917 synthase